jgi:hypothetical protein
LYSLIHRAREVLHNSGEFEGITLIAGRAVANFI